MNLKPMTHKGAGAFIAQHHSHHKPPQGMKYAIGVEDEGNLVGVIVAGRPVARVLDDGYTIEITRCCTTGTPNAASMLYGAATRAAKAMGYRLAVTYTLAEEDGTSLKVANWKRVEFVRGRSWTCPSRPRTDKHPTVDKWRWELELS